MRVLIIGDLRGQIAAASRIASSRGAKVNNVADIEAALHHLRSGHGADVVLIDVKMDVKLLVSSLFSEHIAVPVIGCGLNDSAEDAARAIKAGAKEYLRSPDEELIAAILQAITDESFDFICDSPEMKKLITTANQIAPSDANVLITGESGTGKEMIAKYLHQKSKRNNQVFVCVNCAAIPENLLESELFGHEKGAFTGAVARRIGKFEESNNGTLFLDEISEMDVRLQAKLLRAIQEKEIDRVGGSKPVKINLRIFASSNRNLLQEVKKGTFREDLYFRLNIINLQLPPLRERKSEILKLAEHFSKKYANANGLPYRPLSEEAKKILVDYHWPGNVRELENALHRAVLLATGDTIEMTTSSDNKSNEKQEVISASGTSGALVGRTLESVEKELIINTLDQCLGNRTHAATILGISIRTLRNKLSSYTTS